MYASRCYCITQAVVESVPKCINKPFSFLNVHQVYLLEDTLETVAQAGITHMLGKSPCHRGRHSLSPPTATGKSRKYKEVRRSGDNWSYSLPAGHSYQTQMKNQETNRAKRIQVCWVQGNILSEHQLLILPIAIKLFSLQAHSWSRRVSEYSHLQESLDL